MAANANSSLFLSKISHYLRNITGSSAYWQKAKEDLTAIITHAGPPTFFFTFSSADLHWPELHTPLKSDNTDPTVENRHENVINNPHITDWFFTQRFESFIKHWLYHSLEARGSIHCHGVAKLKNDPGLCTLSQVAADLNVLKT